MYDRAEQHKRKMIDIRELDKLRQLELDLYGRLLAARRNVERLPSTVEGTARPSTAYTTALGALAELQGVVAEHLNILNADVRGVLDRDDGHESVAWLRRELDKIRKD